MFDQWIENPDASYSANSTEGDMGYFARTAIEHYCLTRDEHFDDLFTFHCIGYSAGPLFLK